MSGSTLDTLEKVYENVFNEIESWYGKLDELNVYNNVETQLILSKVNNPEIEVSVVTPAYNASSFLPELYQSLSEQTLAEKLEWIIVDDCSTDKSLEFYEFLRQDSRLGKVVALRNEKNLGAALTLKRGFNYASSQIICWISADDLYLSKDKLEKDVQMINQGYDWVFSRYAVVGTTPREGQLFSVPSRIYRDKFHFLAELYFWNYLPGSSICLKRDAYTQIGGLNEFLMNVDGDFDMIARLILLQKRIGFSDTTIFVRQHPNQTSKSIEKMSVGTAVTRYSYVRFFKERGLINNIRDALVLQWFEKSFSPSIKTRNFSIKDLLRHSVWFEELTAVPYFSEFVFNSFGNSIAQKHELYKKHIRHLGELFMQSAVFSKFEFEYQEIFG